MKNKSKSKNNSNWRISVHFFSSHNTIKNKNMPGSAKLLKKSLSNIKWHQKSKIAMRNISKSKKNHIDEVLSIFFCLTTNDKEEQICTGSAKLPIKTVV